MRTDEDHNSRHKKMKETLVDKMEKRREELSKTRFRVYENEYRLIRHKIKDAFSLNLEYVFHKINKENDNTHYEWRECYKHVKNLLEKDGFKIKRDDNQLFICWNRQFIDGKSTKRQKEVKEMPKKIIELDLKDPIDNVKYMSLLLQNKIRLID